MKRHDVCESCGCSGSTVIVRRVEDVPLCDKCAVELRKERKVQRELRRHDQNRAELLQEGKLR
jgi:hypothetical protein